MGRALSIFFCLVSIELGHPSPFQQRENLLGRLNSTRGGGFRPSILRSILGTMRATLKPGLLQGKMSVSQIFQQVANP